MTDDLDSSSAADEARVVAAATDWRSTVRMLGPRGARWSLPLADVLLGAACLLIVLSPLSFISRFGAHAVYVADLVLEIVLALAQPLRRRMPRTSFVITAVALALYALLTYFSPVPLGLSPLTLTALTSLHAVARWCPERRWGRTALGAALVGALVNPMTMAVTGYNRSVWDAVVQPRDPVGELAICVAYTALIALTALLVANDAWRRRRLAEGRLRQLARERAAAAASERLELARELHDLLGHSLTAIKVQAATALAVGQAETLRTTLTTIEQTAAASLDEVRDLVRALRGSTGDAAPPADLDALDRTLATVTAAGLNLETDLPEPAELTRANASWSLLQRLAVLRTIQEGLTNALRHSRARMVDILAAASSDGLLISVANDIPADRRQAVPQALVGEDDGASAGFGVSGLSERAAEMGGRVTAGRIGDSFLLTLMLPYRQLATPLRPEAS